MLSVIRTGVLVSSVLFLLPGLADAGSIRVCNRGNEEIRVAYLNDNTSLGIIVSRWRITGWFALDPGGDCFSIDNGGDNQRAFFSILTGPYDSHDMRLLKYYPVGDIDSSAIFFGTGWTGVRGVQEFFCVRGDRGFERGVSSVSEARRCPSGYRQQLFTLEVRANYNTFLYAKYRLGRYRQHVIAVVSVNDRCADSGPSKT